MRMNIDESWSDDHSTRIEFTGSLSGGHMSDRRDAVPANGDVTRSPGIACSVDDLSVTNDKVIGCFEWLLGQCRVFTCQPEDRQKQACYRVA